jgi:hypothetical protein
MCAAIATTDGGATNEPPRTTGAAFPDPIRRHTGLCDFLCRIGTRMLSLNHAASLLNCQTGGFFIYTCLHVLRFKTRATVCLSIL